MLISEISKEKHLNSSIKLRGWVRNFRNNQFIALNDGSSLSNFQLVIDYERMDSSVLDAITTGACLEATGTLVESQGQGQDMELQVDEILIYGLASAENYPLQPKKHSLEFLREIAHLRFRTQTFGAIFRIRHSLAMAVHQFLDSENFYYLHSPILTASDAEGAGEMFRVTTLDAKNPPLDESGEVDFKQDFFGRQTHLTVSGQLEAELGALGLGRVYTFGPTFRAENSNTTRHLSEFWMIEPEAAFFTLKENMELAEKMLKYLVRFILDKHPDELAFLEKRLLDEEKSKPQNERSPMPLREKLQFCLEQEFVRVSYTEAIKILENSKPNKKKKFKFPIEWGVDLQSEHERYLVEKHFGKPVIISDYPASIKAFYMRQNEDDRTVAAMDILFPGIGEIVGGSQREEREDVLRAKMAEFDISEEELYWYLDTRRYGSCPHSGFGLGFERMMLFLTGMTNIRDVIPFPRTPKKCEF